MSLFILVTFCIIVRTVTTPDDGETSVKTAGLKLVKPSDLRTVSAGRKPNEAYRVREHLNEGEIGKLLAALDNRHGHRDWLIALLIYRHGLRVSEACDLRWDDIDMADAPLPFAA